jgi:simple sugar transport system ATP-binding protein
MSALPVTDHADAPIVAMRDIVKRYGAVTALAGVDLTITRGEVHAVVGENGAGKTTLMQILAGLVGADAGSIAIRGTDARIPSVEAAYRLGIAMVHQHFMLFPSLTVAENLTIGREPRRAAGLFDRRAAEAEVRRLSSHYGLDVDPAARVASLSVGALQRVEILRALFRGADILILDEPTAVLTPQEAQGLFRVIRDLAADGRTTIFISHKLEEVLEISRTITVLRDGRVTGVVEAAASDTHELARLMVGREVFLEFQRPAATLGTPVLELRDVAAAGLHDVSLTVRGGEIVGVAGVAGNGQTQLAEVVAGLQPVRRGTVAIAGRDVTAASVAQRRAVGLAYVPEDRYHRGLAAEASITDNLLLGAHTRAPAARRGLLDLPAVNRRARDLVERFGIRTSDPSKPARTLSGGNAQRVVIAREFAEPRPLIVAAQPTRGIDIAASEFVRGEILRRRNEGAGVLLISADLAEVLSLADRVVVLYRGRIVGELAAADATELNVGLLMAGVRPRGVDASPALAPADADPGIGPAPEVGARWPANPTPSPQAVERPVEEPPPPADRRHVRVDRDR